MDISTSMNIAASGMAAQSNRIKIIAQNLANAESAATAPDADPYRRQIPMFKTVFDRAMGANVVKVVGVAKDASEFREKFEPSHPAANPNGYVKLPNVNSIVEMADMREAQRSYEASLAAMDLVKAMTMQTINSIRA